MATVTLTLCDRLSVAQTVLDRTVEEAQSRGSLTDSSSALCLRGIVHYRQGQLRDAEVDARLALDQSYAPGAHILRAWNLAKLADILMHRGQLDEAERLLSSDRLGPYDQDSIFYQPFRDATARVSAARGSSRRRWIMLWASPSIRAGSSPPSSIVSKPLHARGFRVSGCDSARCGGAAELRSGVVTDDFGWGSQSQCVRPWLRRAQRPTGVRWPN
jgi:ATP/maltotriose-dependent transcriptional regulator MalT